MSKMRPNLVHIGKGETLKIVMTALVGALAIARLTVNDWVCFVLGKAQIELTNDEG